MKRALPLLLIALFSLLFLSASYPPYRKTEIEIAIEEETPVRVTLRTPVSHAMRAERAGGYLALYDRLREDYEPKDALNYLAVGLGDYLSAECERRRIDPLDATLEWTHHLSSPFIYYEARSGREICLSDAGRAVARAMDKDNGARARLCLREVPPDVTTDERKAETQEMSRYSTDFRTSGESRRHNLALAAAAISGVVLASGETFSFNETVGDRTADRGFREANIVVNGEFVKGIGGGVCQVSTTLYNAALLAGLEIVSAAAHSRPVSYVPYSRDCTVSSAIDFRFRNDSDAPVYLAAEVKGNTLTFAIFGKPKAGNRRLESEVVEEIPFRALFAGGKQVADPANATLVSEGRTGVRSRLYLIREENGEVVRTLIRENLYPPKDAVYREEVSDGEDRAISRLHQRGDPI
ncbi:MAG: VanW family protein [Clostridia bacterium]|nr:VanW family protein [Clostridia bacterium]